MYVNFLFVVFDFPFASCLVFILHIYICSSRTCKKNCHILIGCLFVNLSLTHEPCLGMTTVNLYCFGSPRRVFKTQCMMSHLFFKCEYYAQPGGGDGGARRKF